MEEELIKAEVSTSGAEMDEIDDNLKILTRLELDMAYSSEKLLNLHVLLMHLLAWDSELDSTSLNESTASLEKALVFDVLSGILESELTEVDNFIHSLEPDFVNVSLGISSCRHLKELFGTMEEKLLDSEESLTQSREQVSEIKIQLAKLNRTFSYIKHGQGESDELPENGQFLNISWKPNTKTAFQRTNVFRMLEKSLTRELELEKKLSEMVQNEEQLKVKLHHTEQVAFRMEEAAEGIWERFLEAENTAEVFMGISKEMVGRFQTVQSKREVEVESKLEDCIEQLRVKDLVLQKLEGSNAENVSIISEVLTLRKQAKNLEEQLKTTELQLKTAKSSNVTNLEQLTEMEQVIESLKESVYEAESRAETVETKYTQLTDTNKELSEEIKFLKGKDSSNTKKVTLFEKQLRQLEIQLQQANAASEASQEKQNQLYSAIWDMETLIEDLNSKASKAELQTENAEEKCIILSETNFELNKELEVLKSSLDQAKYANETSAQEINQRTKVMMEMVMQLAAERERIQTQLDSVLCFAK